MRHVVARRFAAAGCAAGRESLPEHGPCSGDGSRHELPLRVERRRVRSAGVAERNRTREPVRRLSFSLWGGAGRCGGRDRAICCRVNDANSRRARGRFASVCALEAGGERGGHCPPSSPSVFAARRRPGTDLAPAAIIVREPLGGGSPLVGGGSLRPLSAPSFESAPRTPLRAGAAETQQPGEDEQRR